MLASSLFSNKRFISNMETLSLIFFIGGIAGQPALIFQSCFISHLYRLDTPVTFATPESQDETLFLLLCWAVQSISLLATDFKSLFLPPPPLFFHFMGTVWWAPTKRCVCFFPPLPGFCVGVCRHAFINVIPQRPTRAHHKPGRKKPHKYLDAPSTFQTRVKKPL